ncbi:DUF4286 family protein [Desertimonas flava]|uniref:DUF4286 family protein n=1 Tax=Desertimonas flava TaxID=2064846 RepID=UPI000E347AE3|nr:DUF4286 family protein [Desertimonas flava]
MARFKFVVLTRATDDRDDEFNSWYDAVHLPDVLAVDGAVGARRYRLAGDDKSCPYTYLTLYDWDAESADAARASLAAATAAGLLPLDDVLDIDHTCAWFFAPMDSET